MSEIKSNKSKKAKADTDTAEASTGRKNKNGRMPSNPTAAMGLQPARVRDVGPTDLRLWTRDDTIHENVAVLNQPDPSKAHLMPCGVFTCGVSESLSDESASVAGTGYRNRRDFDLAGHPTLWTHVELSKRCSFQKRDDKKPGVSSNSNRLQVQDKSDMLQQSGDGLAIGTVAPNAHGKSDHYPCLRRAQRTGGPLVSQHAYGSPGELIYTDQVLWASAECNTTQLRIGKLQPVCKHGHTQPHGACRFMQAYEVHEQFKVQDEHGGWMVIFDRHYSLCILGEKKDAKAAMTETTQPIASTVKKSKRKNPSAAAVAAAAEAEEDLDEQDNSSVMTAQSRPSSPQAPKRPRTTRRTTRASVVVDATPAAPVVVFAAAPTAFFPPLPQPALMYPAQPVVEQQQAPMETRAPSPPALPLLEPPARSPSVCADADETGTVVLEEETPPPSPEKASSKTVLRRALAALPVALPEHPLDSNFGVPLEVSSSSSPLIFCAHSGNQTFFTGHSLTDPSHNRARALPIPTLPPQGLLALRSLDCGDKVLSLQPDTFARMAIDTVEPIGLIDASYDLNGDEDDAC